MLFNSCTRRWILPCVKRAICRDRYQMYSKITTQLFLDAAGRRVLLNLNLLWCQEHVDPSQLVSALALLQPVKQESEHHIDTDRSETTVRRLLIVEIHPPNRTGRASPSPCKTWEYCSCNFLIADLSGAGTSRHFAICVGPSSRKITPCRPGIA